VPVSITNHYVAGGSQQVTVTPGAGLVADSAGLLFFNRSGQTLSAALPVRLVDRFRPAAGRHGHGQSHL